MILKCIVCGQEMEALKESIEESKKCIMLCANCHREIHANLWQLEDLNLEERDS